MKDAIAGNTARLENLVESWGIKDPERSASFVRSIRSDHLEQLQMILADAREMQERASKRMQSLDMLEGKFSSKKLKARWIWNTVAYEELTLLIRALTALNDALYQMAD